MAGCFGSSAVDRWMESRLDDYLDNDDLESNEHTLHRRWKCDNGKKGTIRIDVTVLADCNDTNERVVDVEKMVVHWAFDGDDICELELSSSEMKQLEEWAVDVINDKNEDRARKWRKEMKEKFNWDAP